MEFGKLSDLSQLGLIDWRLPPEPDLNGEAPFDPRIKTTYFTGAPAWGHREWVGKIYPPKTNAKDFLYHYSRVFNCIEINTTHYRIPTTEQTRKWTDQVPNGFKFCAKVLQSLSHSQAGLTDKTLHQQWFRFLDDLGEHAGPCFLQLPPGFSYQEKATLFHFLQSWPSQHRLALEFRHPSWFLNGGLLPALQRYLMGKRIGTVITDVAGRRDVLHMTLSSDFTMVRFIGNNLHKTDFERARHWIAQLKTWNQKGLPEAYFFLHEPDDLFMPEMATWFVQELNTSLGRMALQAIPEFTTEKPASELPLFEQS